ncbi:TonB-dependent receptor [Hymenobacter rubripertinctus]|uniref:TonB-dependent receptor n=1 Tax=Hymenobacter rubripertinctus TaxID=2029981 RepID=A0A418QXC3_9BACT|nr:TonB-dependent receptor [Hymenobacter rubripertinctus]RIY09804.1 TonB-dependent receptor [Hymenobacter rubripertinctus]
MKQLLPFLSLLTLPIAYATPAPATTVLFSTHSDGEAAQRGRLTGQVLSARREPVEGLSVALKGTSFGTMTGSDGQFRLSAPAGTYQLVVSGLGYATQELAVAVTGGETTVLPTIVAPASQQQLHGVTVTGSRTLNDQPVAIGKLPVRPLDLPQSIATIPQPVLEQQQTLRLSDVLANVSGVYVMGTTGGTQEELASRGFAMGSNNTFKNGARFNNGILPEVSSLESFEVLKGSAAILFGNVAAGGIVNLVTKKPRFAPGGSLGLRVGSFDFYKPMLDMYGAVGSSEHVAYRLNATYETARSFRDGVSSERVYANPSLLFKLGGKTEVLVEGDYLRDDRTPDYGVGAINYRLVNGPRGRFLGAGWVNNQTTQRSLSTTFSHRLNAAWQLRGLASYQGYDNDQLRISRPTNVQDNGDFARSAQRGGTMQDYFLGQIDLTGKFETGPLTHAVLVGADADKYNTTNLSYSSQAYDVINILRPENSPQRRTDTPTPALASRSHAPIRRAGAYAQDLVGLGEHLKLLAGVRYSYQESGTKKLTYKDNQLSQATPSYDDAFSPRFGVVYQPISTTSVFASYANSFTLNSGQDVHGGALAPSLFNQYEVGVKNDLFHGLLSANLTAYRIVNSNQAQTIQEFLAPGLRNPAFNPDRSDARELAGEVTSKGLELDVMSKPYQGWSFIAGYSYNHTAYTRSTLYKEGDLLRYNPSHTANLSAYYTVQNSPLKGLQGGLLAYYVGERQAGRNYRTLYDKNGHLTPDNRQLIALSAYAQLDATIGYSWQVLTLRLKAANLLNELSYNVHDDNSVNPIAPRNYAATLTYSF